jgi:dolichol-phosphate mannosyltransferase
VVIPTLNEASNIDPLLQRLQQALAGIDWEVLFVDDDSKDGTRERIGAWAERDSRIRCLHRIGRSGLSQACLEGILATRSPYVAIMDADLQHDEALLPRLFEAVAEQGFDLAVGSRYVPGGDVGSWGAGRQFISRAATGLARRLTGVHIEDPMSGFFLFRRGALEAAVQNASGLGFKLLLDLLLSSDRPLRVIELPYEFRERQAGESKLTPAVAWQLILLLIDKRLGGLLPARFVSFGLVGASGVLVHYLVLAALFRGLGTSFLVGQSVATLTAMTSNFLLNNLATFSDHALRGWAMLRGWISFVIACSIGALANVGIAEALFRQDVGWAWSALAGVLVGSVWNYAVTAVYTWRVR